MENWRPELSELFKQYKLYPEEDARQQLDAWGEMEPTELQDVLKETGLDPEALVTMMCWRAVELGEMTYEGDGYFKLVDDPKPEPQPDAKPDHVVELSNEEFEMIGTSLEATVYTFREMSSDPNASEEDQMVTNRGYLIAQELRKRFEPKGKPSE